MSFLIILSYQCNMLWLAFVTKAHCAQFIFLWREKGPRCFLPRKVINLLEFLVVFSHPLGEYNTSGKYNYLQWRWHKFQCDITNYALLVISKYIIFLKLYNYFPNNYPPEVLWYLFVLLKISQVWKLTAPPDP